MEEIQLGEYVRTVDGIRKIVKINTGKDKTIFGTYILDKKYKGSFSIAEKNILKHSFDIIDLIEPEDYINGIRVINVDSDKNIYVAEDLGHPHITGESNGCFDYSVINFNWFDIKSIVTKEQFEEIKYEVK